MAKSKKALNFDLDTNQLKRHYDGGSYTNAYKDIRTFLENNGFSHRQGSGYISDKRMNSSDITEIVIKLAMTYPWLKNCVKQFDVTDVKKELSLLDTILSVYEGHEIFKDMDRVVENGKAELEEDLDELELEL